jgi:hypothetical protein
MMKMTFMEKEGPVLLPRFTITLPVEGIVNCQSAAAAE